MEAREGRGNPALFWRSEIAVLSNPKVLGYLDIGKSKNRASENR